MFGKRTPEKPSKGISRREMLLGGAGLAAGILGTKALEQKRNPEAKIYKSGETIETPAGPVRIDGWKLKFDKDKVNSKINFEFKYRNIGEDSQSLFNGWGGMMVGEEEDAWVIYGLPHDRGDATSLELEIKEWNEKIEDYELKDRIAYPIQLKSFTNELTEEYERPVVFSEADIGKEQIEALKKEHDLFAEFLVLGPVYVVHTDDEALRGGMYSSERKQVEITSTPFLKPLFESEGVIKVSHELVHACMYIFKDREDTTDRYHRLKKTYERFVKETGYTLPMPSFGLFGPPETLENHPLFKIFDESYYVARSLGRINGEDRLHPNRYGHPYNDHDELVASAMTVLRKFPELFLEEYEKLSTYHKNLVREEISAIFDMFAWADASEKSFTALIPMYEEIAQAIGYSLPK